jgi:hypothetical protein
MIVSVPRWLAMVVLVLLVVGLLAWARGVRHHRGEDVGARAAMYAASQVFPG